MNRLSRRNCDRIEEVMGHLIENYLSGQISIRHIDRGLVLKARFNSVLLTLSHSMGKFYLNIVPEKKYEYNFVIRYKL